MTVVQAQEARVFWLIIFIGSLPGRQYLVMGAGPLEAHGPVKRQAPGAEDAMLAGGGKEGPGGQGRARRTWRMGWQALERLELGVMDALSCGKAG